MMINENHITFLSRKDKILKKIIEQNKLKDFDDAKILPSSIKEKGLI